MKNGSEVIGLSNNSVITAYIADNAITDVKIYNINGLKITDNSIPDSKILAIDYF